VKRAVEATDAKGADAIHDKPVTFPTQIEIAAWPNVLWVRVNVRDLPFTRSKGTLSQARTIAG
jgi:hypothetical protein